ncbi:hypothetical protein BH11ARM1_BH11ARM1_01380 [soil metagenome]
MLKELEHRPAIGLAACLVLGLIAREFLPTLLLITLPVFVYVWRPSPSRTVMVFALTIAFTLGLILAPRRLQTIKESARFEGVIQVTSAPILYDENISFLVDTPEGPLKATLKDRPFIFFGETLKVIGKVKPPWEGNDVNDTLSQTRGRLAIDTFQVQQEPKIFAWGEQIRRNFINFAEAQFPPQVAHVVSAICFNVGSLLDDDTKDQLRRTGTIHIISASGLHVLIIAGFLAAILTKLRIPRIILIGVLALLLGIYAISTGMNPPIVRAVIMILVGSMAYLFRRDPDHLSSLALSGILYLLWRPDDIYSIGFQLSFIVVGAFALYLAETPQKKGWQGLIAKYTMATVVATAASFGLLAYAFGQVSVVSILANLLIEMAVAGILIGAFVAFTCNSVAPLLASWICKAFVLGLVGWLLAVIELTSKPSFAVIHFPEFSGYLLVILYGAMLATWRPKVRPANA